MALEIVTFVLGPLDNNTYLLADLDSGEAVVIDPAVGCELVVAEAKRREYHLGSIWMTHAHFDHLTGVNEIVDSIREPLQVALHPADLDLWNTGGGASMFGLNVLRLPQPTILLVDGQNLPLGKSRVEVRHVPGHTPGHVLFYAPGGGAAFVGDVIFRGSIGRTDLPGGDYQTLIDSIRSQVFSLPPETRLLNGHGPETTVKQELETNPFFV